MAETDKISNIQEKQKLKDSLKKIILINKLKPYVDGKRILHLNCGDGFIISRLSLVSDITGADVDIHAVQKKFPFISFSQFNVKQDQLSTQYDVILMLNALEIHSEDDLKVIFEKLTSNAKTLIINLQNDKIKNFEIIKCLHNLGCTLIFLETWHADDTESFNFMVFESQDSIQTFQNDQRLNDKILIVEPEMEFIRIPGGTFKMGDLFDEGSSVEKPVHDVALDDFYLSIYPVTQQQWTNIMAHNPSRFKLSGNHPVEQVGWKKVHLFFQKLSQRNNGTYNFRLPSEAEWEYAARSGGQQENYAGGLHVDEVAWYEENVNGETHPVGQKKPNQLGLYDMCGLVWEWCQDYYDPKAYQFHDQKNPVCTKKSEDRVIRGGSWNVDAWSARCSKRFGFPESQFGAGLGFRVAFTA